MAGPFACGGRPEGTAGDAATARPARRSRARFRHRVAVRAQQLRDGVEQRPAAGLDARHVLQHDERRQIVRERRQRQREATDREAVERLVLVARRRLVVEQPGEALARRACRKDVRELAASCSEHVGRRGFAPACRRFLAVECAIVVAVEQIHDGAARAGELGEVAHRSRPHVDAAEAAHRRLGVADARLAFVEA